MARLERLVQRYDLRGTVLIEDGAPDDIKIDDLMSNPPANWRTRGSPQAQAAGAAWIAEGRTSILRVPSALVPREPNYVVNPADPDASAIRLPEPEPLEWDARLFGIAPPSRMRRRRRRTSAVRSWP